MSSPQGPSPQDNPLPHEAPSTPSALARSTSTAPRALTARALITGLLGVVTIASLTAFNDYTLANTPLIGNYLPVASILLTFLFLLLVNGPLSRFAPRYAYSAGEICVAFTVLLVCCSIPSTGLVRYMVPSWVMPIATARGNPEFYDLLLKLQIPDWLFVRLGTHDRKQWFASPIVTGFEGRWIEPGPYPYSAFIQPALSWGVFAFAFLTALFCMVLVVRRQWVENERLPFPLAQIQLALIEPPAPGRWLNDTLSKRSFWLAFALVFTLHAWNGIALYARKPEIAIPMRYDLGPLFASPPASYCEPNFYRATFYPTAAAVVFFLNRSVGFSLWFFFVLYQVARMYTGAATGDPNIKGMNDIHFGGIIAFSLMVLWSGRKHFLSVFAQACYLKPRETGTDLYGSAAVAARVLLGALLVMTGWLVAAGCTLGGAVAIVGLMMLMFFATTRIIAEVGLLHWANQIPIQRPFTFFSALGFAKPVPTETFYIATQLQSVYYDAREALPVYASHALKLADTQLADAPRSDRIRLVWTFAVALVACYLLSVFFHVRNEYTYASSLDGAGQTVPDQWGAKQNWEVQHRDKTLDYHRSSLISSHNPLTWATGGFVAVAGLYIGRLLIPAWPLHPVGLLLVGSYPGLTLWFSFLIGWLAKTLTVRFGGTGLYATLKPAAIGIITAEALAAGGWMLISILRHAFGMTYEAVRVLPI